MAQPLSRAAILRIAPFALFMLLLALRGALPADGALDPRWVYAWTVVLVGGVLLWFGREYGEFAAQLLPDARETLLAIIREQSELAADAAEGILDWEDGEPRLGVRYTPPPASVSGRLANRSAY